MILIESLNLGMCTVDLWSTGITTRFADGTDLHAEPEDNDAYRATAQRLGYGTDTLLQCQEHELGHTIVGLMLGLDCSPTLWAVAHGQIYPHWREEEAMVFALQTFARKSGQRMLHIAYQQMKGF